MQMRLTWVSGDKRPQVVQYANGKSETSEVSTFSQENMCSELFIYMLLFPHLFLAIQTVSDAVSCDLCVGSSLLASPAKDFGWHDPGFIHSALLTGLKPSTSFSYRYGR